MTGFTSSFSIESVLRIWDCFFYEGFKVLYRIYLAVISLNSKELASGSFETIMNVFRNIGQSIPTSRLMKKAFSFCLSHKLIERLESDYKTQPKKKYIDWVIVKH